jgi:hypothetical protein
MHEYSRLTQDKRVQGAIICHWWWQILRVPSLLRLRAGILEGGAEGGCLARRGRAEGPAALAHGLAFPDGLGIWLVSEVLGLQDKHCLWFGLPLVWLASGLACEDIH